jgi:hypothetical protein
VNEPFVYAVSPQDFGWEASLVADKWLRAPGPREEVEARAKLWADAEAAVRRHPYWEDRLRESEEPWPRVSGLPHGDDSAPPVVFFTWKIDNNGTTFVVSPVRLPWLEERALS